MAAVVKSEAGRRASEAEAAARAIVETLRPMWNDAGHGETARAVAGRLQLAVIEAGRGQTVRRELSACGVPDADMIADAFVELCACEAGARPPPPWSSGGGMEAGMEAAPRPGEPMIMCGDDAEVEREHADAPVDAAPPPAIGGRLSSVSDRVQTTTRSMAVCQQRGQQHGGSSTAARCLVVEAWRVRSGRGRHCE